MIATAAELQDFAARVHAAPWVAVDTEADSLHAYPEKLCLLQVAIPGEEQLVDPLADLHLEPLWEAFDRHELILHAADYDLHLMFTGHHFQPTSVFDTMWAARLLGESRFGLNDVLSKYLGLTLEKGSQKANWGRRPLTEKMVHYALNDVRHLNPLTEHLRSRLSELGRLDWHRQICRRIIEVAARPNEADPDEVWRIKGHDKLSETGLAVLRALWHWRERDALRTGRPPFFILKHEALSQIAEQAATGGIKAVRLPAYLTPRRRQGVVAAIREGLAVPPGERPQHHRIATRRMTRRELDYSDELRDLRDRRAKELELDPTIIAAKGTLLALARTDSTEWERLLPWQLEILQPGRRTP
ncbi:MAG: HRDC domain-containing protein [Verrucomicrobiae bacterium]|nr:HRDC domain-containing protein [Verrucomicrobiae bacterium]